MILDFNTVCPYCGKVNKLISQFLGDETQEDRPGVGDVSLCLTCGSASTIGEDRLVKIPDEELNKMLQDAQFASVYLSLQLSLRRGQPRQ